MPVGLLENFEESPQMARLGSFPWLLQEWWVCAALSPVSPASHQVSCECGEKPPGWVLPKPRSVLHHLPGAGLTQALRRKHRLAKFNRRLLPHLCGQADKGGFPGSSSSHGSYGFSPQEACWHLWLFCLLILCFNCSIMSLSCEKKILHDLIYM